MYNKNFLRFFSIFILGCQLFTNIKASIEISKCPDTLTDINNCGDKDESTVSYYCIKGFTIYSLLNSNSSTCISKVGLSSSTTYILKLDNKEFTSYRLSSTILDAKLVVPKLAIVICDSKTCVQTTGIIKDQNSKYYSIFKSSESENKAIDISKQSCSSNIGGLANILNDVVVCLTETKYSGFQKTKEYFLLEGESSKLSESTPLTMNEVYGNSIISIDINCIINEDLIQLSNTNKKQKYWYSDYSSNKLILRENESEISKELGNKIYKCEISGTCNESINIQNGTYFINNKIYIFKSDEKDKITTSILTEKDIIAVRFFDSNDSSFGLKLSDKDFENDMSDEDLNVTKLYDCVNSKCKVTTGFMMFNNFSVVKCTNNNCSTYQDSVQCMTNDDVNNANIAYYSYSRFTFCQNSGNQSNNSIEEKEIEKESLYFTLSSNKASSYYLYISNKSGNIIARNTNDGYYYIDIDTDSDGKSDMLYCNSNDSGLCRKNNNYGYFINFAVSSSNSLIYCNKEDGCDVVTKDNGYFVNTNKDFIKCTNSICEIVKSINSNCNSNEYNMIRYYDEFRYCYSSSQYIKLSSITNYIVLSNISTSSVFPNVTSGYSKILLKIDNYSVTQYTTTSEGVCINTDNTLDENCNSLGSNKYTCLTTSSSCTTSLNSCDPLTATGGCNGYYLVNVDEKTKAGTLINCKNEEGTMECIEESKSIIGLFRITDKYYYPDPGYIKCDGSSCVIVKKSKTSKYKLFDDKNYTWEEAKNYCASLGSHLLVINSSEEQSFIEENILSYGTRNLYWLGSYREGSTWKNVSDEPFVYSKWGKYQPSNDYEDKVEINKNSEFGYWNDIPNNGNPKDEYYTIYHTGIICEWDDLVGFSNTDETVNLLIDRKKDSIYFKSDKTTEYSLITIGYNYIIPTDLSNVESKTFMYQNIAYSLENNDSSYTIKKATLNGMRAFRVEEDPIYKELSLILINNDEFYYDISDIIPTTKIYECQFGKCYLTSGYIYYREIDSVIECDKNSCKSIQDPIYCNDADENSSFYNGVAYFDDGFKICVIQENSSLTPIEIKEEKNYIIYFANASSSKYNLFISDDGGNIIGLSILSGNYLISNEDNESIPITCSANTNGSTCTIITGQGYFINNSGENSTSLLFCDSSSICKETTKINGYYINSTKNTIICTSNECQPFEMGSSCSNHENEVIKTHTYNEIKFCYGLKEISFTTEDKYMKLSDINMKYSDYPDIDYNGTDNILIKIDKYTVTNVITDSKGICILDDGTKDDLCKNSNSSLIVCLKGTSCKFSLNSCDPKTGKGGCQGYYLTDINSSGVGNLYECKFNNNTASTTCASVPKTTIGYFIITDKYYSSNIKYAKCNGSQCEKLTLDNVNCNNSVGSLNYQSNLCLCTSDSSCDSLNDTLNEQYFFIKNINSGIFYEKNNNYVVVLVKENSITKADISKVPTNYYIINKELYSLTNDGKGNISINKATDISGINLIKCEKELINSIFCCSLVSDNEYSKNIINTQNTFYIVDCLNGNCSVTTGFVKYNTNRVAKCDLFCREVQYKSSCDSNNYNNAFYNGNFKFCKKIKASSGTVVSEEIVITNTISKIFTYDKKIDNQDYYTIYETSKNGNVVGIYLEDGFYFDDIDGDLNKDIIHCNEGNCIKRNLKGYNLINNEMNSNKLVFCDNKYKCSIAEVKDGYYINEENEVIKCVSSKCYYSSSTTNSCSINYNNKLITSYPSKIVYCYNQKEYSFSSSKIILPISEINAATSKFPNINYGSNTILLEINEYSIYQYTTSNSGICIDSSHKLDNNCLYSESTKYVCTTISSACSVSNNYCNPKTATGGCSGYYLDDINKSGEGSFYNCTNVSKVSCKSINVSKVPIGYYIVTDYYHRKNITAFGCDGKKCSTIIPNSFSFIFSDNNEKIIINTEGSVFYKEPINKYSLIVKNSNYIGLVDISNVKSGIYLYGNQLYLIANDNNKKAFIVKLSSTGIMAFEHLKSDIFSDKLIKFDEYSTNLSSRLKNISLYDCRNGYCKITTGYIKYNTNNTPKVAKCDEDDCSKEQKSVSCKDNNNTSGIAYYKDGFVLCMVYSISLITRKYKEVKIKGGSSASYYFVEKYETSYFSTSVTKSLMISDKGGNIIGENRSDGYIIINNNNENNFVRCKGINCSILNSYVKGYSVNLKNVKSNELLLCDSSSCEVKSVENGIYFNRKNEIIICEEYICNIDNYINDYLSNLSPCDKSNNLHFTIKDGELIFCDGSNKTTLTSVKYVSYNGTDLFSIHSIPNINNNKEPILLSYNEFSVTPYMDKAKYICIKNYAIDNKELCSSSFKTSINFICSDIKYLCGKSDTCSLYQQYNGTEPSYSCSDINGANQINTSSINLIIGYLIILFIYYFA